MKRLRWGSGSLEESPTERGATHESGVLSLEAVMVLPVLAVIVVALLQLASLVSDVLLLHEAARAGVRVAATSSGTGPVTRAAARAAPELPDLEVRVTPAVRGDGDLVDVRVAVTRRIGPISHQLSARAHARVEPAVGTVRRGLDP